MSDSLHSFRVIVLGLFALALISGMATVAFAASTPSQGFVKYSITLSGKQIGSYSSSFTINESASQTSQAGFSKIGLAVSSADTNLSISKILNTSSFPEIFPYLPGINGSYSFETHGLTISANLQSSGTSSVAFEGKSYQVTNYVVSVSGTNASGGESGSLIGNISTMPTGLIYSAQLNFNGTFTAGVLLLSTDLPLVSSITTPISTTIGVAIVGASVFGAVALAVPALFKRAKNSRNETKDKPDYWVD